MDIMEEWVERASRDKNYGHREDALMTLTDINDVWAQQSRNRPSYSVSLPPACCSECVCVCVRLWTMNAESNNTGKKIHHPGLFSYNSGIHTPILRSFLSFFFCLSFFLFLISYSLSYSFGCNSFLCGGFWGERRAILHSLLLETLLLFPPHLFFFFFFFFFISCIFFFFCLQVSYDDWHFRWCLTRWHRTPAFIKKPTVTRERRREDRKKG
jgi:hypothetical protein